MAARLKPPVFLARTSYRQRRLRDAARLLPILGAALWMIPLLWLRKSMAAEGETAQLTSIGVIYIFGVWSGLILLSFLLSRVLRYDEDVTAGEESD
jgi:drug/metabolite transporter (DMT)-like permease